MAGLDDLSRVDLDDIFRRLRQLETAAPLQFASIGASGIRVFGGGVINIENGGLIVNGTATIHGTLNADGTISLTGTFTQSGPSTFTGDTKLDGPTHINGATDIKGTLSVEGASTLKGNLDVTGGGKIAAGNTTISPSASNGGIEFLSGGGVGGNGGAVTLKGTGNAGVISNASMTSMFAGSTSVDVSLTAVTINGLPTISSVTPNLYMDPTTKQIKRIV